MWGPRLPLGCCCQSTSPGPHTCIHHQAANDSSGTPGAAAAPAQGPTRRRFATLGKDPTVRSDFLPDKDRDREEQELREQLKQEWEEKQVGHGDVAGVGASPLGLSETLRHVDDDSMSLPSTPLPTRPF